MPRSRSGSRRSSVRPRGVKAVWHDAVWSKVIAAAILGAAGSVAAILWKRPSPASQSRESERPLPVASCQTVRVYGHVEPNGAPTVAWFEWGDTPALGYSTPPQHFTTNSDFYQDIVTLKESTAYWVMAVVSNKHGTKEGTVKSFTTPRCKDTARVKIQ